MEQTANPINRAVGHPINTCAIIGVVGTSWLAGKNCYMNGPVLDKKLTPFLSPAACIVVPKTTKASQQGEFYGQFKINVQRNGL